jgi:hypothetical protein
MAESPTPRQFLIRLLIELERLVPPPPLCHHAITYAQFGSDAKGWEDKLALQVNVGGVFHCLFVEEDDFDKDPARLAFEAAELLKTLSPSAQAGVGPGQYVDESGPRGVP